MLRIHQISSAAAAQKYYSLGGDYYGQELVGEWAGKGAALLGLTGQVDQKTFDLLCDNQNPLGGSRLTAHSKGNRTPGYDFNFNCPKGVSLLYGTYRDPEILDAFRSAVRDTMADIESEMKTRVRKNRRNEDRVVGNLVAAEFIHFTTRPVEGVPDPALHAHMVVFNAVHDPVEHAWKAGFFRDIKRDAPYFEALFHNRLSNKLARLGYAVEKRGKDWDVTGVPRSLVQKFSRRTRQIDQLAEKLGIVNPEAKAKLGATSREHKARKLDMAELCRAWMERLTGPETSVLEKAASKAVAVERVESDADAKAVKEAVHHLFERRSVIPYRELLAQALRRGPGKVTLEGIRRAIKKQGILLEEFDGRLMATIPQAVEEEKQIIGFAKETRGTRSRLGKRGRAFNRDWLGEGQKAAVEHALNSTDQVILIEGRAGVGKTTLTEEIVDGIMENGRSVVMVAPSAQASRGTLREAGFKDADTLQRLLLDENMQETARGNVIIVDEAGLVGAPTMRRLLDLAAQLDSRVILIGDRNQHRAPGERGLAFELLAEKAKLPVARVDDIRRQKDNYREAVKLLADRRIAEGFDRFDRELGWVKEAKPEELYGQAAEAFVQALDECRGDALAVSPTHAEIDRFTTAIREKLSEAGKLSEEREVDIWKPAHMTEAERADTESYESGLLVQFHKAAPGFKAGARLILDDECQAPGDLADRFSVYRPGKLKLAIGDRVRLTANGFSLDKHRLNNGAVYGVAGFTPQGHIRLDSGWLVSKDWGHLASGWVTTSHSAQSRTVRRAVVVQSSLSLPASRPEQIYVSASRARDQTLIFTDSKAELRQAVQREDKTISATDLVNRRRNTRSRLLRNLFHLRRHAPSIRPGPLELVAEPGREVIYDRG